MPRKRPDLTKSEQQRIRSNISRQATQIGNRLSDFALGKDGVTMTSAQVRAGLGIIGNVLPAMQSQEITDITERQTFVDIEAQYQAAMASLTVQDLRMMLESMEPDDRDALLNSVGETRQ